MGETAALIGLGAAGLGSGLLSSASARSNNKESIAFSRWSQLESQRYNKEMYEKQLADQERLYNAYQSPQAIAQALAQVGVNPASALSQVSGKALPSVPSASGSSPVGAPHLENEGLALGQGIQQMAGAVNAIAGAKMQDAQSMETRGMLQHKINGMLITQGLEQAQKDYQGLMNTLTEKYGDKKWSADIQDLLSKAVLNVANGNLSDAQSDYTKVLKMISDEDLGMKQEERAIFGTRLAIGIDNLKKQGLLLDEQAKTERASQAERYASASYSRSLAKTENALRSGRVELQSLSADLAILDKYLRGNELKLSDSTLQARTFGIIEQMYREGLISENVYKEGQLLSTKRDWASRQEFADYLSKVCGAASSVMNSYTNYRGVSVSRLNAKERNAIQRDFVDEYIRQSKQSSSAKRGAVLGPDWEMYSDQFFGR